MSNEELQQLQPLDLTKEHYPLDIKLCSEELPTDPKEFVLAYYPGNNYWVIVSYGNYIGHKYYWRGMFTNYTYKTDEISMWAKLPIVDINGDKNAERN